MTRIPRQIVAESGSALGFSLSSPWSVCATQLQMVGDGTHRSMLASQRHSHLLGGLEPYSSWELIICFQNQINSLILV